MSTSSPRSGMFERSFLEDETYCKSGKMVKVATPTANDYQILRCLSEGAVRQFDNSEPGFELLSGWVARRASSAPNRRVSIISLSRASARDGDASFQRDLFGETTFEGIKIRWRAQQIAMQKNLDREHHSWLSGWLQSSRCALNVLYRHK